MPAFIHVGVGGVGRSLHFFIFKALLFRSCSSALLTNDPMRAGCWISSHRLPTASDSKHPHPSSSRPHRWATRYVQPPALNATLVFVCSICDAASGYPLNARQVSRPRTPMVRSPRFPTNEITNFIEIEPRHEFQPPLTNMKFEIVRNMKLGFFEKV